MKKHGSTIFLIFIFVVGLSLLLYPTFANWWNSFHQSRVIASYSEVVANMDDEQYAEVWNAAWEYNQSLIDRLNDYLLTDEQKAAYGTLLNVGGNGIMGYVEIPSIEVLLPVYHGTDASVLQVAVGHLEWTSLPVGGESTHCVVSGHRGLPSARLFTDLDKLEPGDVFLFRILDEVLTYEVDQILIVDPQETKDLLIIEGQDLCTLVTCTPYGINSHRMLVRGHRIDTAEAVRTIRITADAIRIEPILVAPLVAAPILLMLLISLIFPRRRGRSVEWTGGPII